MRDRLSACFCLATLRHPTVILWIITAVCIAAVFGD